jgi:hypothetical protein
MELIWTDFGIAGDAATRATQPRAERSVLISLIMIISDLTSSLFCLAVLSDTFGLSGIIAEEMIFPA